jgi:hypothetical protein
MGFGCLLTISDIYVCVCTLMLIIHLFTDVC